MWGRLATCHINRKPQAAGTVNRKALAAGAVNRMALAAGAVNRMALAAGAVSVNALAPRSITPTIPTYGNGGTSTRFRGAGGSSTIMAISTPTSFIR